jgi:GH25 family lysozyme M1 (1,4-beta-N-acetylmuramidase)
VRHALLLAVVVGCAQSQPAEETDSIDQAATVCGVGPTVKGIDVSYYQGTINWTAVKNDGVKYAFIRVSDGLNTPDTKFSANWSGSRNAGIYHGAYQFFRPSQDAIAQADLLLSKIGNQLAPDDLPPVIDVEATDGMSASAVASGVHEWVQHVTQALGRRPIIYTGKYFWQDNVGDADETASPLWHAQYTSASCPNIADAWPSWAIWQYSSSGSVAGISGNVDMDRWNGDLASLQAFLGPPVPCAQLAAEGGVIDDGDPCFVGGGPSASMRHVTDAGEDGDLVWTHTTEDTEEANYGQWNLDFAEAGHYQIEVYTDAAYAQSKLADYLVHTADGDTSVTLDQTAVDGWQTLGTFSFAAGADQYIHLGDNTGELLANNVQLVFDAVRITRADFSGPGSDPTQPGDNAEPGDMKDGGGCDGGGGGASWAVLMAASCVAFRRRSASRRR